MKLSDIKSQILDNAEEIRHLYSICVSNRKKADDVCELINQFSNKLISENEYKIDSKYVDCIGFNKLLSHDYAPMLEPSEYIRYNQDYYELAKLNKEFCDYFNLVEYHDNVILMYPNAARYYEDDVNLLKLFRSFVNSKSKVYKIDSIEKEYKLVEQIILQYL